MNNLVRILRTFLYFKIIAPVHMHYIYADNPSAGYVSINNAVESYPVGFAVKPRRYLELSGNPVYQKGNEERGLDNTKITRTPNNQIHHKNKDSRNYATNQRSTEPPMMQKTEDEYLQEKRNVKAPKGKSRFTNTPTVNAQQNKESKQDYKVPVSQRDPAYQKQRNIHNAYDNKGNIMQVNVHKTQIAADPQKVKLNTNRQLTALSVQRRDENFMRAATSAMLDKPPQKSTYKERNAKVMLRVLDDMTKKITDRRIKNSEYTKRDTDSSYENSKRNGMSDNIKQYIVQDMNVMKEKPHRESARIGSSEVEIEDNNAPYALFYRMTPESLDNQDGFYLMKSMDDKGEIAFTSKDKPVSMTYQNDVDHNKPKTKKNYNTVKLKNKMKNYSKLRNK